MIKIDTEFTPNPNSLKFNVDCQLLEKGSAFFKNKEEASVSPLALKLFEIESVSEVFIGQDFVTITRDANAETWGPLIPKVTEILQECIGSGQPIVEGDLPGQTSSKAQSDIEKRICQVLDEKVRPAVARDGGDIIFHGFNDGVVTLHLQGACASCPSSIATLKSGVERILCDAVPEVREVVQV